MINIGVIGLGFGSKVHIPGFQKISGVRVLGIAGKSVPEAKAVAKENNIPLVFSSWKKLVTHPEISAISIAVPPPFQKEIAIFAARHRKHIFCEKPLGLSALEAKTMLKAAEEAGIVHAVDFEFRNISGLSTLKKFLAEKKIGQLRHVNITWLTGGRAGSGALLNWQNMKNAGGGALFAFGSHVVDYTEMLFGKIKSVSASLSIAKKNGATAEDTCDLLFTMEKNIVANVSISNVLPNACGHLIEIYGEAGSLKLINKNPWVKNSQFKLFYFSQISDREISVPIPTPKTIPGMDSRLPMFLEGAKNFIAAVKENKKTSPSFKDGFRAQVVLDAIKKSNHTKKNVLIPN